MVTISYWDEYNKQKGFEALVHGLCHCFDVSSFREAVVYKEADARLLKFLLDGGYVTTGVVGNHVHDQLLILSQEMHRRHIETRCFPDHLGSQAVFGYGLRYGKIHPKDVKFDHGEIAGEYIVASDGLLESVVEQLLTYKDPEPIVFSNSDDIHCCC